MKKVFIIHGFNGSPNGSWLPWLMGELKGLDVYACALSIPKPEAPVLSEWLAEIARHVDREQGSEIYLVGHSMGVAAILNYLQALSEGRKIAGALLVSGRLQKSGNPLTAGFYEHIDLARIKSAAGKFAVIHGDSDPLVPFENGVRLAKELGVDLIAVKGGHLTTSEGFRSLPQALEALEAMF